MRGRTCVKLSPMEHIENNYSDGTDVLKHKEYVINQQNIY
jgi:hypothetical protein